MGIISSGVKALTKSGARKAPKAAAKKAAPKAAKRTAAEFNAEYAAIVQKAKRDAVLDGVALAAAPVAFLGGVSYEMDKVNKRKAKEARARLPKGTDKFGWAGRR
jgi:hypothetical protein